MKLKYYLRGLGVGIICTAIIMGIALSGKEKEKLTDAEVIERARLLGMVMAEEQEEQNNQPDEVTDNDSQDSQDSQVPQVENQEPIAQEPPAEQPTAEQPTTETPATEPEIKTVEILPGEYSDVVSQKLFEAGLIPDAAAFNKYLMDSGKDQNIMVGVHQIPMGSDQDEIIRILGEKPE